jgi:hypothetical protein
MTQTQVNENVFEQLGEILKPEPAILQHLEGKAKAAHRNTSFSPERRGEQMIKEYSEELTSDIEELKEGGASEESISDYKSRYERYFSSYLGAKSNCFSIMITGGSNFPVRRHEKANRSEERHYTIFREWRIRAKKTIVRKAKEPKTFLSELDRYKKELERMKANHEKMKEGNKRIAAARKTGEDITQYLTDTFGIKPHMIDWTLKFGFGLANNSANMRRVEERIKLMEVKEAKATTTGQKEFPFEGFTVIYNYEADRIQVKHDSKPAADVIQAFKRSGFRWSPSFQAWQRQMNANGIWAAERLLKIELPKQ